MSNSPSAKYPNLTVKQIEPDYVGMPRHWFEGNPYLTHFVTSLFFLFPAGERYFVAAVKNYLPQITDPELREAVKKFMIQEANHGTMHEALNVWMDTASLDTTRMRRWVSVAFASFQNYFKKRPMIALAVTVAAEHLTSIIAAQLLTRTDHTGRIAAPVRALATWHAIEEIEHRSVAFDVYKAVGGTYVMRAFSLVFVTTVVFTTTFVRQMILVARDGELLNIRAAAKCGMILAGPTGFFTGLIGNWLAYFKPQFHPSEVNYDELLAVSLTQLEALTEIHVKGPKSTEAAAS